MAQRHLVDATKIETVLLRLEELVRANSGDDPFEEIFKILLVKIYCEHKELIFIPNTKISLVNHFNMLLQEIAKDWPGLLTLSEYHTNLLEEHLSVCLEIIKNISLYDENLESLDMFFEYLVTKNSKGEKGQFFTPRHIIDCCVKIINPKVDDYILDPACGSGGFLFHALNHIRKREEEPKNIFGFDFDARAIKVAKTLMTVSGSSTNNLYTINSLLKPSTTIDKTYMTVEDILRTKTKNFLGFDIIITNPPFAGEIKEKELIGAYEMAKPTRRNERDILFVERCVELLKPNGKLAIVLPHNKIGGKGFSYFREWLIRHVRIVGVLSLPRTTFLPHTHQKAEIIFAIKREKPLNMDLNEEILFLISDKDSKDSKGNYIYKDSFAAEQSNWDKVNHDLDQVVEEFEEFIKKQDLEW